jgi:DASS family divalent anion:Na+ symporter
MLAKLKAAFQYFNSVVPFRLGPALITTVVLVTLLLWPVPEGLTPKAWGLVAIFLTTIVAIILKVMPIGVMAMMAIVVLSLSQVTSTSSKGAIADALTAFDSPLIWLIVVAILISRGVKKTGLAPFTPSNTARGGGIVHPIMKSIATAFDSDPAKGTEGKVGTYLALVNYHANPISSAMFVTATAPNPLVVDYIAKATNQALHLSWMSWALCMLLPGLLCMLVMPMVIYVLSPPQLKATPNAVEYAHAEMAKMGPVSPKERVMIFTFALLLLLWANIPAMVFGPALTLDPTVVAFVGLFVLIITGTIDWDDVLSEKSAWDTLIWFGALIMLAEQLNKQGVIGWFSTGMSNAIVASGIGWGGTAAILVAVFVFSHYLFASTTAHISAMMLAFLTVGVNLIPPAYVVPFMLLMAAGSAIMMTLTHYATGTSPIIFGSGYVTMGNWWRVGFVMCVVELLIFAVVGTVWWKVLGYW